LDGKDAEALLTAADRRMYSIKHRGPHSREAAGLEALQRVLL
jgi:hypothetical protein